MFIYPLNIGGSITSYFSFHDPLRRLETQVTPGWTSGNHCEEKAEGDDFPAAIADLNPKAIKGPAASQGDARLPDILPHAHEAQPELDSEPLQSAPPLGVQQSDGTGNFEPQKFPFFVKTLWQIFVPQGL